MNHKTVSSMKNRSRLSKRYYYNPTENNKNLLTAKSNKCSKAYWLILKNNKIILKNNKNITNIFSLNINGKIISNINKKVELFNLPFVSQYTPINNSSVLPPLDCKTNKLFASANIKEDDIYLILKNLNPVKPHG